MTRRQRIDLELLLIIRRADGHRGNAAEGRANRAALTPAITN